MLRLWKWEEIIWKPFRQKYFIEASLQAQNLCVTIGKGILMKAIIKQLNTSTSGGIISTIINEISDVKLWTMLKEIDKANKKSYNFLLKFNNDVRKKFAHDISYYFQEKCKDTQYEKHLEERLKKMEEVYNILLNKIKSEKHLINR